MHHIQTMVGKGISDEARWSFPAWSWHKTSWGTRLGGCLYIGQCCETKKMAETIITMAKHVHIYIYKSCDMLM